MEYKKQRGTGGSRGWGQKTSFKGTPSVIYFLPPVSFLPFYLPSPLERIYTFI
jgi:hypothetical protein